MEKGDLIYYTQIMPTVGEYNLLDLKVRTIGEDWFAAIEAKTKRAYLFNFEDIGVTIFDNRIEALNILREAEEKKPKIKADEIEDELCKRFAEK